MVLLIPETPVLLMAMKVKTFDVILEKGESGWIIADVPALPGCHTQGKTRKEALKNIKEAIELYLEGDLIGN